MFHFVGWFPDPATTTQIFRVIYLILLCYIAYKVDRILDALTPAIKRAERDRSAVLEETRQTLRAFNARQEASQAILDDENTVYES